MKNIFAFVRAAAPWVAMALVLVLLTVRGATKKKTGKKPVGNYGTEGMCLGTCFGAALGSCIHKNWEEA